MLPGKNGCSKQGGQGYRGTGTPLITQISTDKKKPGEEDIGDIYRDQVAAKERALLRGQQENSHDTLQAARAVGFPLQGSPAHRHGREGLSTGSTLP